MAAMVMVAGMVGVVDTNGMVEAGTAGASIMDTGTGETAFGLKSPSAPILLW